MKTIERYKDFKIVISEIKRDWSEDAYMYEVAELLIKDECEDSDNAIMYAKKEIDEFLMRV